MANRHSGQVEITPEVLLKAYACGIFPMAEMPTTPPLLDRAGEARDDSRSTGSTYRRGSRAPCAPTLLVVRVNRDFEAVIGGCAEPRVGTFADLDQPRIRALYRKPARDRALPHGGGLCGDAAGRRALRRVARPRVLRRKHVPPRAGRLEGRAGASRGAAKAGGFRLLDTQFITSHLRASAPIEVSRRQYNRMLDAALEGEGGFRALPLDQPVNGATALKLAASTSLSGSRLRAAAPAAAAVAAPAVVALWPLLLLLLRLLPLAAAGGASATAGCPHLTIRKPDVIDRMLDRVQARAGSEHPACEDAADVALQRNFVTSTKASVAAASVGGRV